MKHKLMLRSVITLQGISPLKPARGNRRGAKGNKARSEDHQSELLNHSFLIIKLR